MKRCFVDIETTGFHRTNDCILEIAAICIENGEMEVFHTYIKPTKSIPKMITQLTGISSETVKDAPGEREGVTSYCEWLQQQNPAVIIGHNYDAFDGQFLDKKSERYDVYLPQIQSIDTLKMARRLNKSGKMNSLNCKQVTLGAYFDIQYEAHSAIEDVKALMQIYSEMNKLELGELV